MKYNIEMLNWTCSDKLVFAWLDCSMHVRGHNLFWGTNQNTPDWAQHLTGDQLKQVIEDRINFFMDRVSGK